MTTLTPDIAAQELAVRLARFRTLGAVFMDGSDRPNAREQAWANEFINDLLGAGWTPPEDTT